MQHIKPDQGSQPKIFSGEATTRCHRNHPRSQTRSANPRQPQPAAEGHHHQTHSQPQPPMQNE